LPHLKKLFLVFSEKFRGNYNYIFEKNRENGIYFLRFLKPILTRVLRAYLMLYISVGILECCIHSGRYGRFNGGYRGDGPVRPPMTFFRKFDPLAGC
jgi:hypothetical protein